MKPLYFNNAFSKQPLPEAVAVMQRFLRDEFENPLTESNGAEAARNMLDGCRSSVAGLIHAKPAEIHFVSSGTEANNWALKGAAWNKKKNHLIISAVEHFSVYQTALFLQGQGFEVSVVPVNDEGFVNARDIARAIRPATYLVSIQSASDEIGIIQDISSIAALKRRFSDVVFHTDAIQYLCYESLDVSALPFDLVSATSNAIHGPAGIAALYIRENTRMIPLLHGGMQEGGLRPGLQSIALVAGFQKAAEINAAQKHLWRAHVAQLQAQLLHDFDRFHLLVVGDRNHRTVDNILVLADADGEAMLTLLLEQGIRASSGSTCYQYAQKESHVLHALGISRDQARGALLFTLDKEMSSGELREFASAFEEILNHLRSLKP